MENRVNSRALNERRKQERRSRVLPRPGKLEHEIGGDVVDVGTDKGDDVAAVASGGAHRSQGPTGRGTDVATGVAEQGEDRAQNLHEKPTE